MKVGGNTANCLQNWKKVTNDPWILQQIVGITIPLSYSPYQGVEPRPISWGQKEKQLMQEAIGSLSDKNVIECCNEEPGQFVSNVFMVPKSNGKVRIILDLSRFNEAVEKFHFKMDNLHTATNLIIPGVFMSTIDLQDAYFTFPIRRQDRKYLKFRWEGQLWQFIGLPMGITCAPRYFTKLVAPIFAYLRSKGLQGFPYLDDSFVFGFSQEECSKSTRMLTTLFTQLGFKVHTDKSVLVPSQRLEFLGFIIDSTCMTVELPPNKIANVLKLCDTGIHTSTMTIRQMLHIVGTLNSYSVAVEYGGNHFKHLENDQIAALKRSKGDFDVEMCLSAKGKQDLLWWKNHAVGAKSKIKTNNPDCSLTADASNLGWGAILSNEKIQGEWTEIEQELHINVKELLAIFYGLQFLASERTNCMIHVISDNTTAVSHINKMGGVRSKSCMEVAFAMWNWCEVRKIWLYATHLPGVENEMADSLSRRFSASVEWELSQKLFEEIVQKLGQPSVDLFASRHNTKVTKYCSWFSDQYCWKVDAFSFEWTDEFYYIFPPFRLVGRCWRKIMMEGTKAILVTPDWPNQHWYGSIQNTAKKSIRFPGRKGNLSSPSMRLSNIDYSSVRLTAFLF